MTERTLPTHARLIPDEAVRVFEGEIFDVYHWQQQLFDGSYARYEMLRRPDTVVILAIDEDGQIIMVDEEQSGGIVRKNHLPVGRVEPTDRSVLEAAQREMREETGYEFSQWDLLNVSQPESKIEWFVHLFLARHADARHEPALDPGEKIIVKRVPYAEAIQKLAKHMPSLADYDSLDQLITGLAQK